MKTNKHQIPLDPVVVVAGVTIVISQIIITVITVITGHGTQPWPALETKCAK